LVAVVEVAPLLKRATLEHGLLVMEASVVAVVEQSALTLELRAQEEIPLSTLVLLAQELKPLMRVMAALAVRTLAVAAAVQVDGALLETVSVELEARES
jgi:hypothetical protein